MSAQENVGYAGGVASAETAYDSFQPWALERARAYSEDSVRQYLVDIGQHPLLTGKDEVEIAQTIDVGRAAKERLEQEPDALSEVQMAELFKEIRWGEDAAQRLVNSNLRLVVSIAKRYTGTGVPLLDLIQEGNLGLIHAVEKFDWQKGFKFSTYATWWIRQAVQRGLPKSSNGITLSSKKTIEWWLYAKRAENLKNSA